MDRIGSPPPRSLPPQAKSQESKTSPPEDQGAAHPSSMPVLEGSHGGETPSHELTLEQQIEHQFQRTLTSLQTQCNAQETACRSIFRGLGIGATLVTVKQEMLFDKLLNKRSFEAAKKEIGKLLNVKNEAFSADQIEELKDLQIFWGVRDEVREQLAPFAQARRLRDLGLGAAPYPVQWYANVTTSLTQSRLAQASAGQTLPPPQGHAAQAEPILLRPRSGNNTRPVATQPEVPPTREELAAQALIANGLVPEGDDQAALALTLASSKPSSQQIRPEEEAALRALGLI